MKNRFLTVLTLASFFAAAFPALRPAAAHEFWIEPHAYQIGTDEPLSADLVNGQNFKGARFPYFAKRTKRFDVVAGGHVATYTGRMGDMPALSLDPQPEGLVTLLHETAPETLVYKTWDKFAEFAAHKDFPDIRARHQERDLPFENFTERYSRHSKSLIAVGNGEGQDRLHGLETEFLALENPYTFSGTSIPVMIYYQGAPRADAQIEVFERASDGTVTVFLLRSDAEGRAEVPVKPGHSYLLDAVVLRPSNPASGAVWYTLWAALTFAVP